MTAALERSQFIEWLRREGSARYHDRHPYHLRMHAGELSRQQLQQWVVNRYYYQTRIPIKDAVILSKSEDPAFRRMWLHRIQDHDGTAPGEGGLELWLRLAEGLGLDREEVRSCRGVLSGVRFACDAYVTLVKERSLLEAVASSLTELFSPQIISERIDGMLKSYDFVSADTLAYFSKRPPLAQRDSDFALDYVKRNAKTPDAQQAVLKALEFKCDVLWAMLDALYHAYVAPKHVPPGAFVPKDGSSA